MSKEHYDAMIQRKQVDQVREAALYVRKSTSTEDKQQNSLRVQLDSMYDYCRGHFEVKHEFKDEKTGRTLDREGLQEALAWLSEDPNRALIFYKTDRYARTLDSFEKIRSFIESDQIRFMDIQRPDERADMLMIQLRLMISENESRLLGNRIKNTIKYLRAQGQSWGGDAEHMAMMRERSHKTRGLKADHQFVELMKYVTIARETMGVRTQSEIVDAINAMNFKTPKGKEWTRSYYALCLRRARDRGLLDEPKELMQQPLIPSETVSAQKVPPKFKHLEETLDRFISEDDHGRAEGEN